MLPPVPVTRFVLASASPARLATLRAAGLDPEVIVSGVDEDPVSSPTVPGLVAELARLKATAVADQLGPTDDPTTDAAADQGAESIVVLGFDSLLELDGDPLGKPGSAAEAVARWRRMRGRSGTLHTGHHLVRISAHGVEHRPTAVASTTVHFAELSDAEIDAYVATGEPLVVAGAFTVDGLGGAFVTGIEGDHHNVVGVSLPLLRRMLADLGIAWTDLWTR